MNTTELNSEWQLINRQDGQTTQTPLYLKPSKCLIEKPSSDPNCFPSELLLLIFSFLGKPRDLVAAGLTCHHWHLIAQDENLRARKQILRSIPSLTSVINSIEQKLLPQRHSWSKLRPDILFKVPYEKKGITKLWIQDQQVYLQFVNGIFACLNLKNYKFNEIYKGDPAQINWIKIITNKALIHFDTKFKLIDLDTKKYTDAKEKDYFFHTKTNEESVALWKKTLLIFSNADLYEMTPNNPTIKSKLYENSCNCSIAVFKKFLIIDSKFSIFIYNLKTRQLYWKYCRAYIPLLFQKTPTLFIDEGHDRHLFHRLISLKNDEQKLIRISTKVKWDYDCQSQTLMACSNSKFRFYDIKRDIYSYTFTFNPKTNEFLEFTVNTDIFKKYGKYYLTHSIMKKTTFIWEKHENNYLALKFTLHRYSFTGDMLYQINKKGDIEFINLQSEKNPSNKVLIIEYEKK